MIRFISLSVAGALMALAVIGACASGGDTTSSASFLPHMRPAEQGTSAALYFTLQNPSADTLVLLGVDIDVAGSAGIHQSTDHNGMASMHPLDSLIVFPGDSLVLSERGLHVMANGLRATLSAGDTVAARLRFRGTRVDTLRVLVRE